MKITQKLFAEILEMDREEEEKMQTKQKCKAKEDSIKME